METDKKTALERLGFEYKNGRYQKLICENNGNTYTLTCELGGAGYKVDKKSADGSENTNGAGYYRNSPIWEKIESIVKSIKDEMEASPIENLKDGGFEFVQDAVFEEVGEQRNPHITIRPSRRIKGLTLRLAECGKVKIGKKGKMTTSGKGTEFRQPTKIDYFLITTMEKNKDDDFKEDPVIMKILTDRAGEENEYKCRSIPVRLPYDDPTLNFPTCYAHYEGAACKCRGDGELAVLTDTGATIKCTPEECKYFKNNKCKPNGILSVILDDAPTVGGVYKFRTVGWNSINNLISSMEFIRGLTNGFLAGLPLMLTLTPKHTTIPGKGTPVLIYMVNLEYRGSLAEMAKAIRQTMDTRALMQYSVKDFEKLAEEALALPEAPDECKAIVEEFYPEAVTGA